MLDHFFTAFHLAFVLLVVFGWAHPKTCKAHVTALLLTMMSWLLLGLYQGSVGYCFLTGWHWDVKRALGETGMPSSFVEYIIEKITGINFSKQIIDAVTGFGLVFGVVMSAFTHIKRQIKTKEKSPHMA